jgi:hypothetical protein
VSPRRERVVDALVLVVAKLAIGAWALHQGFSHVSDDDYARTVIAERFAHAPALDPSGTSWLPLPFWVTGVAMRVGGRSLEVARAVAVTLGAASVAAPYVAMRGAGMPRAPAVAAVAVAMALPWNAWLGVATVPEGWIGAIVAAAVIAMPHVGAKPWAAAGLLAASLSRYEAWPACAVLMLLCVREALRASRPASADRARWQRDVVCALVAGAGPVAWMAWNAHAHGSALHFVARVTTFRQAIGAANVPLADKLLGYPRALVEQTPEAAALGAVGLGAFVSPALRARWGWAAAAVLVIFVFLVWGDVRDGAPTHHAARALAAAWWVLVAMGVDALYAAAQRSTGAPQLASPDARAERSEARVRTRTRKRVVAGAAGALACLAWAASLPPRWRDGPGRDPAERRDAAIAQGLDMRERGVTHADIVPCAFEHFALIAAWGEPERALVAPRTGEPIGPGCPHVTEP